MDGGYYWNLRGSGGAVRDRRPTDREARHTHPSYSGQEPQMATITLLRQRVIEDKTVRNLSAATRQSYIYAVAKFSRQFIRSPDQLSVAGAVCRLAKPPRHKCPQRRRSFASQKTIS
jgi:hypothetical protein